MEPRLFSATNEGKKIFDGLYTINHFETLLKERENDQKDGPLKHNTDYKTAKFVDVQRISPVPEVINYKYQIKIQNLINSQIMQKMS